MHIGNSRQRNPTWARRAARKYDDALEQYRKALQIQPGFGPTYSAMADAYRRRGRYLESVEAWRKANSYWNPGEDVERELNSVAKAYADSGKRGFLLAALSSTGNTQEPRVTVRGISPCWETKSKPYTGCKHRSGHTNLRSLVSRTIPNSTN